MEFNDFLKEVYYSDYSQDEKIKAIENGLKLKKREISFETAWEKYGPMQLLFLWGKDFQENKEYWETLGNHFTGNADILAQEYIDKIKRGV